MSENPQTQELWRRAWGRVAPNWRPILIGIVIFVAGAFVGATLRAIAGAEAFSIEQYVQGALIAALGAVLAGALAIVGSYWGGHLGAEGASRAAQIAAEATSAREREAIRDRLVILGAEYVDQVVTQSDRRDEFEGADDDGTMIPTVGPIDDYRRGVLELFVRGAQKSADIGENIYNALRQMGRFAYVAPRDQKDGAVTALSDEYKVLLKVWVKTELVMRTEFINTGLCDEVVSALKFGGQLEPDYLFRKMNLAIRLLKDENEIDREFGFNIAGRLLGGGPYPEAPRPQR